MPKALEPVVERPQMTDRPIEVSMIVLEKPEPVRKSPRRRSPRMTRALTEGQLDRLVAASPVAEWNADDDVDVFRPRR